MATEEYTLNRKVITYNGFTAGDGTPAAIAGRMIDIPTGKAGLLKEHQDRLSLYVINEIVQRPNCWIDIYGYASKLGDVDKNLNLSKARAAAAKAFLDVELRKLGRSIEGMVKIDHGFGENAPDYNAKESDNSAEWRAVGVFVFGSKPADVKPPTIDPKIPPRSTPETGWKVAAEYGGSGGGKIISIAGGQLIFTKLATKEQWRARYIGAGLGLSLSPLSITISTKDMPSTDGRIHSFQKIETVDQLLSALSIMAGISVAGVGGTPVGYSGTAFLFGLTFAPVPGLWNLYTFLFRKQVLAVAGLRGWQLGIPDAGVSAVQIKFVEWKQIATGESTSGETMRLSPFNLRRARVA